jgi:hypothetical protein
MIPIVSNIDIYIMNLPVEIVDGLAVVRRGYGIPANKKRGRGECCLSHSPLLLVS